MNAYHFLIIAPIKRGQRVHYSKWLPVLALSETDAINIMREETSSLPCTILLMEVQTKQGVIMSGRHVTLDKNTAKEYQAKAMRVVTIEALS